MADTFTFGELAATLLALGITGAFGAWASVVKKAADTMGQQIESAVRSLDMLREEIHRDRVNNEKRFVRLETTCRTSGSRTED